MNVRLLLILGALLLVGCSRSSSEPSSPPGGGGGGDADIVWGALGDSQTDEYHGDDQRGGETVLNWLELLVVTRGLDFGEWSNRSRGEPRRRGYAHNWARSSANMGDVVELQLEGLAQQVEAGEVTHVVLFATSNEWMVRAPLLVQAIYDSPDGGITDARGNPNAGNVRAISGAMITVIDRIAQALERAGSPGGLVVLTQFDFVRHPLMVELLPDPVRRAYVSSTLDAIHQRVATHAEAINEAAGRTVVSVARSDEELRPVWSTADGRYVTAAGVRLDYTRHTTNGDPHYLALAPTGGSPHMGTIGNGVYARAFIEAANRLDGVEIDQLTDEEIREVAGLGS